MSTAFVIGYDPGGNSAHGVAALEVREERGRWNALGLQVKEEATLHAATAWVEDTCSGGRIVAAGVDTLTEWNSGRSGWRPADCWLRRKYPAVRGRVIAPNSMQGAMAINGAAFLTLLQYRFQSDRTMVTEAHPKVAYYARTEKIPDWENHHNEMVAWFLGELGISVPPEIPFGKKDHCFDAGVAGLAALRGLNREWTLDLHDRPGADYSGRVEFCGRTHYWWPEPPDGTPT